MTRVFGNRLERLEAERGGGQTRMIWTTVSDPNGGLRDMTEAEIEAEIAARKAAGTLQPQDRLLLVGWRTHDASSGNPSSTHGAGAS
jgi:hypothetical protein